MSTKVERKIASTLAHMASITKGNGSHGRMGSGFACIGVELNRPQYFQYDYRATQGFVAIARGDLNGDGVLSRFELEARSEGGSLVVDPSIRRSAKRARWSEPRTESMPTTSRCSTRTTSAMEDVKPALGSAVAGFIAHDKVTALSTLVDSSAPGCRDHGLTVDLLPPRRLLEVTLPAA